MLGYALMSFWNIFIRGRKPYFSDVVKHSILCGTGTLLTANLTERFASEFYYNRLLIDMADKYNFTPEEVMELQRNLNQYYIRKDRENDIQRDL